MKHLLIGPSAIELGRRLQQETGIAASEAELQLFPDGESCCRCSIPENTDTVVIVQGAHPPQDRHLMQLCQMVDTAARQGVPEIICVIPYLAYSRQDRCATPRDPLSSRVVVRMLEALGMTRLITIDVHHPRIFEYCNCECLSLSASAPFVDWLKARNYSNPVLISPDSGGRLRVERIAQCLGWPVRVCVKHKDQDGRTWYEGTESDVAGREAVVIDDLCSSGSTLIPLAEQLYSSGVTRIAFGITHFFADADHLKERIGGGVDFFSTNSIPTNVSAIDLAPLIAAQLQSRTHIHSTVMETAQ